MSRVLQSLKNYILSDQKEFTRTLLITEGFGFCVSLSLVWGRRLDQFGSIRGGVLGIFGGLIGALLICQLVTFILLLINGFILKQPLELRHFEDRTIGLRLLQFGCVSAVIFLLWLPIYLAYYPAIFSYDAEAQLYQAISGNYSTHHPLIHTLIMKAFMGIDFEGDGINTGMSLYAIWQMLTLALMLGASVTIPWKKRRLLSTWATVIIVSFFGLFPVFGILAISTTKDVLFAGIILLLTVLIYCYEDTLGENIAIGLVTFVALLFRNNALYAIVPTILILLLMGHKTVSVKLILAMTISVVAAILTLGILKASLNAESGSPREALSIPIQQMARVKALHNDELEPSLKHDLNELIADEWMDRYDEHLADPIKERISMKQPKLFITTWLKLGLKYPGDYFDAWLLTVEGAFYLRDTSCNRIYGEGLVTKFGYLSTDIRNMPEGFGVTAESKYPMLMGTLENLVSANSFEHIPLIRLLFAPSLYIWIVFGYFYWNILRKRSLDNIALIYPIMYFMTLLLSPAILVRYMFPYFCIAPIIIGIYFSRYSFDRK